MRQGRAQSRSASRTKTSSPSPSLGSSMVKKSTKLPQIAGVPDDVGQSHGSMQNASGLIIGVCSQQGKRPYQEDEYCIRPFVNQSSPPQDNDSNVETHFFGLFDGHAGGRCSNYVAGSLANVLAEDPAFFSNLPQALKRSFHQTNDMFLKVAEKMKYHDGSTGITAVVRDSKVLVANVGDCRCLIISGGRPIQMSIDQKPTNPEEQKRIVALGGTVVYCMGVARVNRVLAVSRAFGNRTLRTVIRPDAEMMQRELTKDDDYIVMASDGLWDVLKNKDVCDMCYSAFAQNNPQTIAEELVQTALMRGSMDNVTCIVVRLTDYVQRIFSNRAGSGAGASGSNALPNHSGFSSAAAANATQNQYANGALERASSLRNVPGSTSQRLSGGDQQGGDASGGLLPLSRQYSTGSIGASSSPQQQHSKTTLPLQVQAPQLAPVLDNYLYSPSRGTDSPSFQLPSATGHGQASPGPGIATLRQHMHRDGSFNFEEEDSALSSSHNNYSSGSNSINNSGSGSAWLTQQSASSSSVMSSGGAGAGAGFVQNGSSVPYAARRPNTMGGRTSFTGGMPNLISMFNNSMPQINGASSSGNNALAPLTSTNSQKGGMWNSEGDYSGSSYGTDSTSGSRAHPSQAGYQQRAGALGSMFPNAYKRPPSKK